MHKKGKVILIGNGRVGAHFAYAAINQQAVSEIGIIDMKVGMTEADAWDMSDGVTALGADIPVYAANYEDTTDAQIIVITAGVFQTSVDQSRLDLLEINKKIFSSIVNEALDNGFDGIFLIATNPCDVLADYVRKISGFPANRVISTGTLLDSSRFRRHIATRLNVLPSEVDGMTVGEHGDSQVLVYSQVKAKGEEVTLTEEDKEYINKQTVQAGIVLATNGNRVFSGEWKATLAEVLSVAESDIVVQGPFPIPSLQNVFVDDVKVTNYPKANGDVMNQADFTKVLGFTKSGTWQGIGMCITRIVKAIIQNERAVLPVGNYFEEENVYASWPCIIGHNGIEARVPYTLNNQEKEAFANSLKVLKDYSNESVEA